MAFHIDPTRTVVLQDIACDISLIECCVLELAAVKRTAVKVSVDETATSKLTLLKIQSRK